MRLVFIGATEFSRRCLAASLGFNDVEVVGIITARPRFEISYRPSGVHNVRHADLVKLAEPESIPVITVTRGMGDPGLLDSVANWRPDAFLVAGWFHMVPRSWRQLAPAYGLHASLLPAYRGGAPLVWAMINGEEETGITFFMLDDGVDTGPIVGQRPVGILPDDTIATLYARIEEAGVDLIRTHLPGIADGTADHIPQRAPYGDPYPQRGPEDGLIDWSQTAETIDRFIRAQARPYPGAFTVVDDSPLRVWRAAVSDSAPASDTVGRVRRDNDGYVVQCGEGVLRLLEVRRDDDPFPSSSEMEAIFLGRGRFCPTRVPDPYVAQ